MTRDLFLLIFFCSITAVFSQTGKAIYVKQLASLNAPDSNMESNTEKFYKEKIKEELDMLEYELTFQNKNALYRRTKSLKNVTDPIIQAMIEGVANYTGVVYFDGKSSEILHQKEFDGKTYIIQKTNVDWLLSQDTLKIDDYLCYKAMTKKTITNSKGTYKLDVIAWYAPEISLPYGPDGFGGLPGLILRLEYNGVFTALKSVRFVKESLVNIVKPSKGIALSEDEYQSIVAEAYVSRPEK